MPILSMSAGRVTAVRGQAWFRQPDGSLAPVRIGDELTTGQQVLTDQQGIVEIMPVALSPRILKYIQAAAEVDRSIKGLESREPEFEPAAGANANGSGSLLPGLRVDRVEEALQPAEFAQPQSAARAEGGAPEAVATSPVNAANRQGDDGLAPSGGLPDAAVPGGGSSGGGTEPSQPPADGTLPDAGRPVQLLSLSLSEEGLPGGLADGPGAVDVTHAITHTVHVDLTGIDRPEALALAAPQSVLRASNGAPLMWVADGQGGLAAFLVDAPNGQPVLDARWDAANGNIAVTLHAGLHHADASIEDVLTLDLALRAGTANAKDVAIVQVAVEDDSPARLLANTPVAAQEAGALAIQGSVFDSVAFGGDGSGGVHSVMVGDQTHLTDSTLPIMTVLTQLGGLLTVNALTGQYSYVPSAHVADFSLDSVRFTLQDGDGDKIETALDLVINNQVTIHSTPGPDVMTGHDGTDVFTWHLNDAHLPNSAEPNSLDEVRGFELVSPRFQGGDVLDLRDLLQGEHAAGGGEALSRFISVETLPTMSTVLNISTGGHFDGSLSQSDWQDHSILMHGIDLRAGLGLAASASSADVINALLKQGNLLVDP